MVGLPEIIALVCFVAVFIAETLHQRRIRSVASLVFGPDRKISLLVRCLPVLTAVAAALCAWGFATLLTIDPKLRHTVEKTDPRDMRHVVFVLDVSPSMRIEDAGSSQQERRSARVATVLRQFFRSAPTDQALFTVIATYTDAKPVVVDTRDADVILNITDRLPLSHIFEPGRTRIFKGLEEAARITKSWPRGSASLIVLTDGDTLPPSGMPRMPPSVSNVVVVGVGGTEKGTFINGRNSRQDVASLKQMAARLHGTYINGNIQPIPPTLVDQLAGQPERSVFQRLTRREYALIALATGALSLAIWPELLAVFGTAWRPGRRAASPTPSRKPAMTT